jgi:hypothetical protein
MRVISLILLLTLGALPVRVAASADFTIRDEPSANEFVGIGAQFNGYLYCPPNTAGGGVTEKNVADLERKIVDLQPQHVRVFVEIQPDSRQGDPVVKASVIRTIALAQRAGATVNCTLWHGPYPDLNLAAQQMADMMADFIRNHHLTAIKYVTLQNEPNSTQMTMERYNALYRAFHDAMKRNGLRDQIKIVGGDLLAIKQPEWFHNLADNLADVCDGYSVHMYSDYWDEEKLIKRRTEIAALAASLPRDRQRPIYLTEFGFRGHRTDKEEPGKDDHNVIVTDTPMYALTCAWRMIDAIKNGFVALVYWDAYDAWYDREPMQYGLLGQAKDGWPIRPHYRLMWLFTHSVKPGWHIVPVEGSLDGVLVTAMRSPQGEQTFFAVNRLDQPALFRVHSNVPRRRHYYGWNLRGNGALSRDDGPDHGVVTLPPRSVIAITTTELKLP